MRRALLIVVAIAIALATTYLWFGQDDPHVPVTLAPATPIVRSVASPVTTVSPASAPEVTASGAEIAVPRQAVELSGRRIAELGLTRQLAGEHRFVNQGRSFQVLGTKETTDGSGTAATMLLIVDDLSGQILYHLPGLQFSLKQGVDYEAFIREHPQMRRLFVNPLYAQVSVDAAEIAEQFAVLRQDPRVDRLRLMTREPVKKPK